MDSFKKQHHKRHGGHHHHHHKKQFGDYQTILDPIQSQATNIVSNQMYLDEKPIQLEEQKTFTNSHHHPRKEFNKDFQHKDHHHRGGFGKDRPRDGFKKHHNHNNFNRNHHEESFPLENITNVNFPSSLLFIPIQ